MVLPKSKNAVGLGNSLMNDRFGKGKGADMRKGNFQASRQTGTVQTFVTKTGKKDNMNSITEQGDLDEFLSTAELAGTDFTAERMNNVKIIHTDQKNPYLLSPSEQRKTVRKQNARRNKLVVPRRPPWDENTTAEQLDTREREAMLEWRRGLAALQENEDLLMTPFERNLEVWRQLWRVIERSDLIVQIVDARNPLLFRSADLVTYVREVDPKKRNLLLVNKADMLTETQRRAWAEYFVQEKIEFQFFSAELAKLTNESRANDNDSDEVEQMDTENQDAPISLHADTDNATRIATTDELESLFLSHAPESTQTSESEPESTPKKLQVGLVGYPNVGKSSTINALVGAKKVSVSATPGKTKHFQTIHLSDSIILCDCPGLVFPNFASTRAELVVNGILPIDQLREYTGPAGLVTQRIPQDALEARYGMHIRTRPLEEGGTGVPTARELLTAYAAARGFASTGQGGPDESRAARIILKDYVKGKLLFCQPPPTEPPLDANEFNAEIYGEVAAAQSEFESEIGGAVPSSASATSTSLRGAPATGDKSQRLDKSFFGPGSRPAATTTWGSAGHLSTPWGRSYANVGLPSGKQLQGRKMKEMLALENNVHVSEIQMGNGKKHHKKGTGRAAGKKKGVETGYDY